MRHNTMSKKHGTQHNLVAELWVLTAVIAMIVVGDALAVSVVAVAIVMMTWWIYSEVGQRHDRKHGQIAPVTHLRPGVTDECGLAETAGPVSWHGPRAA